MTAHVRSSMFYIVSVLYACWDNIFTDIIEHSDFMLEIVSLLIMYSLHSLGKFSFVHNKKLEVEMFEADIILL